MEQVTRDSKVKAAVVATVPVGVGLLSVPMAKEKAVCLIRNPL